MTANTYLGITLNAGRPPFTYAALDQDKKLIALDRGRLESVLAFAAGQSTALAAIDTPVRPNQGLIRTAESSQSLLPDAPPLPWTDLRMAEYHLEQAGFHVPHTPGLPENCSGRQKRGFILHQRLQSLGYTAYPDEESPRRWLEVSSEAVYWAMLGQPPFPGSTLESRLQRQLVLYDRGLPITDPMDFFNEITRHRLLKGILPVKDIFTPPELAALAAAYVAWLVEHQPAHIVPLGDPREGEIFLPGPLPAKA